MSQTDRILRKINAKNDRRSAQPLEKWRTWVKVPLPYRPGRVDVPDGPGLGFEFDEEALSRLVVG